MEFQDSYRESASFESSLKGGTILPFFGFTYAKSKNSTIKSRKIYDAHYDGNNSWKIEARNAWPDVSTTHYGVYQRTYAPTAEEKEFASLSEDLVKDPWGSPYIPTSLEEFHKIYRSSYRPSTLRSSTIIAPILIAIFFTALVLLVELMDPEVANWSAFGAQPYIWLVVVSLVWGIPSGKTVEAFRVKIDKRKNEKRINNLIFENLSQEEMVQLREDYFNYMVQKYGEQRGAILRRHAINQGYDKM